MDEMGQLSSDTECSVDDIKKWLEEIRERIGPDDRKVLNAFQFEVVKKFAERVCIEKAALINADYDALPEPLRWSMHGGPGTGKTHVINTIKEELFEQVLKWNIGVKFQIVALHAVMVDLLAGDTIHRAFNIPVFGKCFQACR